jgi:uncharacterized protein YjbI with pentapeptide repeats
MSHTRKGVENTRSAGSVTGPLESMADEPEPACTAPRDRLMQLVGWFTAVVLALAIALMVLAPTAQWLAFAARSQLLILCAGLFAAGVLLSVAGSAPARPTLKLLRQWQVSRRYAKAIEQLSSDSLKVRTGGIYALARVARRDSARYHPAVMEVLATFIRERSHDRGPAEPGRPIRSDVQAALSVIGRRDREHDIRPIDLTGADLTRADLTGADLTGADLTGAHLTGANVYGARLAGAQFTGADLTSAHLARVDLAGAHLENAILRGTDLTDAKLGGAALDCADLYGADLIRADLTGADLTGADLAFADLYGATLTRAGLFCARLHHARLTRADLTAADLTDADLSEADLGSADVRGAHLAGASWPRDGTVPDGWTRNTGVGRLKRAGSDSRQAELIFPVHLQPPTSADG